MTLTLPASLCIRIFCCESRLVRIYLEVIIFMRFDLYPCLKVSEHPIFHDHFSCGMKVSNIHEILFYLLRNMTRNAETAMLISICCIFFKGKFQ